MTAAPTPSAPSLPEGMYLVSAGGDNYSSEIVPLSGLDDAYLRTQWCTVEDIDPEERRAALEHFHDPEEWTYIDPLRGGKGRIPFEFSLSFEDGWVRVALLPDADRSLRAGQSEPVAEVFCWLVELFHPGGNSMGFYHTGFSDMTHQSRTTKNPHEARRYNSQKEADRAASGIFSKAGVWRAVEHGFGGTGQSPIASPTDEQLAKAAYDGFDSYWGESSDGDLSKAWLASAKAVLALAPKEPKT